MTTATTDDDPALPSLEAVADGFLEMLRERYPTIPMTKHRLQAPGYAVRFNDYFTDCCYLLVKTVKHALLVDYHNTKTGLRRLAVLDYDDPGLAEKAFSVLDKFVVNGVILTDRAKVAAIIRKLALPDDD